MPERYVKVGKVVYGTENLRWVLDALSNRLAAASAGQSGVDSVVADMDQRLVLLIDRRSTLFEASGLEIDTFYK